MSLADVCTVYPTLMGRSWLEQLKVDWQAMHMMTPKTLDLEWDINPFGNTVKFQTGARQHGRNQCKIDC